MISQRNKSSSKRLIYVYIHIYLESPLTLTVHDCLNDISKVQNALYIVKATENGCQMAEWLGNQDTNQQVAGLIPICEK